MNSACLRRKLCPVHEVRGMQIATASEMRHIDQRTIELYRVPGMVLMEHAGLQLLRCMQTCMPGLERCHVTIVTGRGINGGARTDGGSPALNCGIEIAR